LGAKVREFSGVGSNSETIWANPDSRMPSNRVAAHQSLIQFVLFDVPLIHTAHLQVVSSTS